MTAAQPPITFKPGPLVGEDANIVMVTPVGCIPSGWGSTPAHLNPNPNSPEISMHANSIVGIGCSEAFDKSLIRFSEINTVLPPGATINYAELRLYTLPTGTPNFGLNAVNVRRITGSNWVEASITWSSAAVAWGINAGSPTPAWSAAPPIASPSIPNSTGSNNPGMVAVDVTNDVTTFHGGSLATNTGWILELQTESRSRWMKFASSDHPDSTLWPELYIDYTLLNTGEDLILEQVIENTQDAIQIAPNPATDMVFIHLGRTHEDFVTVILTDVAGKVMYKAQHPVDKDAHTVNFSVAELPAAFYSVQVQNGTRMLHGKMVRK